MQIFINRFILQHKLGLVKHMDDQFSLDEIIAHNLRLMQGNSMNTMVETLRRCQFSVPAYHDGTHHDMVDFYVDPNNGRIESFSMLPAKEDEDRFVVGYVMLHKKARDRDKIVINYASLYTKPGKKDAVRIYQMQEYDQKPQAVDITLPMSPNALDVICKSIVKYNLLEQIDPCRKS